MARIFFSFFFFFFSEGSRLKSRQKGIFTYFSKVEFEKKKKKSDCSNRKSGKRDSRDFVIHRLSSPLPWLPSGSIVFLYSETRIQGAVDGYADFYLSERYEFLVLLSNVKFSFTFIVAALRGHQKKNNVNVTISGNGSNFESLITSSDITISIITSQNPSLSFLRNKKKKCQGLKSRDDQNSSPLGAQIAFSKRFESETCPRSRRMGIGKDEVGGKRRGRKGIEAGNGGGGGSIDCAARSQALPSTTVGVGTGGGQMDPRLRATGAGQESSSSLIPQERKLRDILVSVPPKRGKGTSPLFLRPTFRPRRALPWILLSVTLSCLL